MLKMEMINFILYIWNNLGQINSTLLEIFIFLLITYCYNEFNIFKEKCDLVMEKILYKTQ